MPIQKRFKLVSRQAHPANSTVKIREGVVLGRKKFHVMAGPCSVEGEKQLLKTAEAVKAAGATVFRSGALQSQLAEEMFTMKNQWRRVAANTRR